MADLFDRRYTSSTPKVRDRNLVASLKIAQAVMTESSAAPGHDLRAGLAGRVINTPSQASSVAAILGQVLASVVVPGDLAPVGEDVTEEIPGTAASMAAADTTLENNVSAVWNAVAGFDPNP